MTDESVLHEKEEGKKKFLSVLILSYSGEKCQIIEMAFKKKLKPNLSKTLQVLGTVAIVSEMNAIQLKLAAHFIPLVHLLISEYIIHTLSPKRDLCSSDLRTFTDSRIQKSLLLNVFSRWLFKGITSRVI